MRMAMGVRSLKCASHRGRQIVERVFRRHTLQSVRSVHQSCVQRHVCTEHTLRRGNAVRLLQLNAHRVRIGEQVRVEFFGPRATRAGSP